MSTVVDPVVLRPFRSGPEDYPGMAAANQRSRDAAGIEEVITPESLARDYERLTASSEAMIRLASIHMMLRRLKPS